MRPGCMGTPRPSGVRAQAPRFIVSGENGAGAEGPGLRRAGTSLNFCRLLSHSPLAWAKMLTVITSNPAISPMRLISHQQWRVR